MKSPMTYIKSSRRRLLFSEGNVFFFPFHLACLLPKLLGSVFLHFSCSQRRKRCFDELLGDMAKASLCSQPGRSCFGIAGGSDPSPALRGCRSVRSPVGSCMPEHPSRRSGRSCKAQCWSLLCIADSPPRLLWGWKAFEPSLFNLTAAAFRSLTPFSDLSRAPRWFLSPCSKKSPRLCPQPSVVPLLFLSEAPRLFPHPHSLCWCLRCLN